MEVDKFDVLLNWGQKEYILRLQIHVDDLVLVQVCDSAEHLCDHLRSILLGQEHATVDILINLTK